MALAEQVTGSTRRLRSRKPRGEGKQEAEAVLVGTGARMAGGELGA